MDNEALAQLVGHYMAVLERVDKAVAAAGRKAGEVKLLAVSKLHPAEMVQAVAGLGQVEFGENYVQEALEKRAELEKLDPALASRVRWHMIGHVQSRKAPLVAGAFALVQSVDSVKLASALEKRCAQAGVSQDILIEVNVGEEEQKTGLSRADLHALSDHLASSCPHLALNGLMCIPPAFDLGAAARPYFALLRELREELRTYSGLPLPELSMGMSGDFEWAVLEGATMVRVGTDIFGARRPKKSG